MKKGQIDFWFLATVFVLLALGLMMVMSASSESARIYQGDAYHFIKHQLVWAIVSIGAMLFFANFDYHKLIKLSGFMVIATVIMLGIVLIAGTKTNGGQRWLALGPLSFQPSEVAKISMILYLAGAVSKNKKIGTFLRGLLPNLIVVGVIAALLIFQPHFSATVLIVGVSVIILFVGGVDWKHLVAIGIPIVCGGVLLLTAVGYSSSRITTFFDPFADPLGAGYQIIQSLYAIASGGLFGLGLGQSRQKFLYIPEPHNDFIFSIWCEEFGFFGAIGVILLFVFLIYRGIKIAMNAKDKEGALAAVGIISLISLQVIMNMCVVTAGMPVTGISLPFFSYGGTALLAIMSSMGIMLNISKHSNK